MVVRDATPEAIAALTQPRGGAPKPPTKPAVDSLDKFKHSMRDTGFVMNSAAPSSAKGGGGSRPGSASIFNGGGGSRPASKQQRRIASDSVWPDDPPSPGRGGPPAPQPGAVSVGMGVGMGGGMGGGMSGGMSGAGNRPVAGRPRAPPADMPGIGADFGALGLGGLGGGGGGGVGRRIQGTPWPDAPPAAKVGPTGQIASSFTPSFTPSFANANAGAKASFANPPVAQKQGQFLSTFAAPANPTGALGFARDGPAYAAAMRNVQGGGGNGIFKIG